MMMENKIASGDAVLRNVRDEMQQFDNDKTWNVVYESTVLTQSSSVDAARDVKNRWKNRYRDVSPCKSTNSLNISLVDSTRVFLCSARDGDYINASFVFIPEVPSRKYILTQGPMQQTVNHFWLMVWERQCPAIIMLNRLVEKGSLRCHPYFPYDGGSSVLKLEDVNLNVELECEINAKIFISRKFIITNIKTNEVHHVLHMQYTNWPDFGIPNSPSAILNFLWSVRASGALNDPCYPPVIHCSAGIGRSGTFVLIDLALILIEQANSISGVDIKNLFLELRKCRMGIIQTADQLRFCYRAVIKAADTLLVYALPCFHYNCQFEPDKEEEENVSEPSSENDSDDMSEQGEVEDLALDDFDSEEDVAVGDIETELFNPLNNIGVRFRNYKITTSQLRSLNSLFTSEADSDPLQLQKDRLSVEANHLPDYSEINMVPRSQVYNAFEKPENGLSELSNASNIHVNSCNRINNALPTSQIEPFLSSYESSKKNPILSTLSTTHSVTSNLYPKNTISRSLHTIGSNISLLNNISEFEDNSDSYTKEYLAASIDLHERRTARLARQARMRAQIEVIRTRMRETDMTRKRWLPTHVLQYLRRFYAESGYVKSKTGAIISSILVVVAISFGTIAYIYW
ncbi:unnamed protein product [Schistosoma margrebowiei]|uniref:protein-tyrosine-phosphatase n=1 Tax=Schistosoma margrebowiei TaxID=48269 RepID=A0A183MNV3_9TREM|nr:unnamed protein product [Schistosoma margrebowiei]